MFTLCLLRPFTDSAPRNGKRKQIGKRESEKLNKQANKQTKTQKVG